MQRRFYRSTSDKYLGGVCGGLAEYFDIDPALVRILFVLMFLAHGFGLLAYIIMWIAVRRRPATETAAAQPPVRPTWGKYLPGALLILLGLLFLVHENWYWLDLDFYWDRFWPLLLIGVGLLLVLHRSNGHKRADLNGLPPSAPQANNGGATV